MKIKMLQGIAGADFALSPGEVTDRFSQGEAIRLVAAGIAAPVTDVTPEMAIKPLAPEARRARNPPARKASR